MNKKLKIALDVIYFIITIGIGILIAIITPSMYYGTVQLSRINSCVESENYDGAYDLVGGFYQDGYDVLSSSGHKITLAKSATIETEYYTYQTSDGTKTTKKIKTLERSYSGFITLVEADKFNISSNNNLSKLVINGTVTISILDYNSDSDSESINDTVSTLENSNYIYYSIPEGKLDGNAITSIELFDATNESYMLLKDLNYGYDDEFFTDVKPLTEKYYEYVTLSLTDTAKANAANQEFAEMADNFTKNSTYHAGGLTDDSITKEAGWKTAKLLILYAVIILVLGDFICKQYIIRLTVRIYRKIKGAIDKKKGRQDVLGHDYYSSFSVDFDLPEDFHEIISMELSNSKFTYRILTGNDGVYKCTTRVHAGIYAISKFECPGYTVEKIKDPISVDGYQSSVVLKIIKDGD